MKKQVFPVSQASCVNDLKQWGLAESSYASDNTEFLAKPVVKILSDPLFPGGLIPIQV